MSFSLHSNPKKYVQLLFPFCKWQNGGTKRLSNVCKTAGLTSGRAEQREQRKRVMTFIGSREQQKRFPGKGRKELRGLSFRKSLTLT